MENSATKQVKVYFIRPKPAYNFDNMPVYLSAADDETHAWLYVLKHKAIKKHEYYIDHIFIPEHGVPLGLLWNPHL